VPPARRLCVCVCAVPRIQPSAHRWKYKNNKKRRLFVFCALEMRRQVSALNLPRKKYCVTREMPLKLPGKSLNSCGRKFFISSSHTKMCTRAVPLLLFSWSLVCRWALLSDEDAVCGVQVEGLIVYFHFHWLYQNIFHFEQLACSLPVDLMIAKLNFFIVSYPT
jgi:hypothetical protein